MLIVQRSTFNVRLSERSTFEYLDLTLICSRSLRSWGANQIFKAHECEVRLTTGIEATPRVSTSVWCLAERFISYKDVVRTYSITVALAGMLPKE